MAVKRRPKKQGPGVPEWVVTFGDLMSLLLTFFILLQMFSEMKREHEYQRVITAIKEAFGYGGGIGAVFASDYCNVNALAPVLELFNGSRSKSVTGGQLRGFTGFHHPVCQLCAGGGFTSNDSDGLNFMLFPLFCRS